MHATGFARVLLLADFFLAGLIAVLLLLTNVNLTVIDALGWLFVVIAVYLASLLVP